MWRVNEGEFASDFCPEELSNCVELTSSEVCEWAKWHNYSIAQRVDTPAEGPERPTNAVSRPLTVEEAESLFAANLEAMIENLENGESDPVSHPKHYTSRQAKCSNCEHPIECIDITQVMGFCEGNAIKYIWRADYKGSAIQDLEKAAWYIQRELERRKAQ